MTDAQRLAMFRDGFTNLRRATTAALRAGDADAAHRSVAVAETHLEELRWLYAMMPDAVKGIAWVLTSCERAR